MLMLLKKSSFIYLCTLLLFCVGVHRVFGQTSLRVSSLSVPSCVSPYYFGPNAFAIPDMLDGTPARGAQPYTGMLRVELAGEYYAGFSGDRTTNIAAAIQIPLFTERVNLSLWMPIYEWYAHTSERLSIISANGSRDVTQVPMRGHGAGDVYVSTDIWALQAERHWLDMSIRAAMKTASGGGYADARFYDSPGYFFDVTLAKPIVFKDSFFEELRFAVSSGFLCWQTDNGRQNDGVMYGAMVKLRTKYFTLAETFSGYAGWENNAARDVLFQAHDCPMSLKTQIAGHYKNMELNFQYQYGLMDYPYHQFRIGFAYNFSVLKR